PFPLCFILKPFLVPPSWRALLKRQQPAVRFVVRLRVDEDRIACFTLCYKTLTDNTLSKFSYESAQKHFN
ncbi:hypothetical protein, partial [Salmonella enterica]|uniref:hypothetical protein n=1 Tax=Salmonella enterica TaxID=28901 RepID=UPI003297AFE5